MISPQIIAWEGSTAVTQIIPGDMDQKRLAETVNRRDADVEPPWMGSRRVSARRFRFMSVVNNGSRRIHWYRDMNGVSPPKTRRRPIHGGSNPASMRDTVFGGDTQSMPLKFVGQQWLGWARFLSTRGKAKLKY